MSERIGVIRDNGVIVNTILWNDGTADQLTADGVTDFEEVTHLNPLPGIGWTWDVQYGYRKPKTYASWVWNGSDWEAPIPMPTDGKDYQWDETTDTWVAVELPSDDA